MMRAVLSALAGYVAWSVLWLGGNKFLFAEAAEVVGRGEVYTRVGPLAGALALSVVCSLVAGAVAAVVGAKQASRAVLIMAVLLLVTGIAVQASVWSMMPLWYHLVFLALLVPVSMMGSRIGNRSRAGLEPAEPTQPIPGRAQPGHRPERPGR